METFVLTTEALPDNHAQLAFDYLKGVSRLGVVLRDNVVSLHARDVNEFALAFTILRRLEIPFTKTVEA